MIGRWHGLVIDCPDPDQLATFYAELLGMIRVQDEGDWVVIGDAADRPGLAFQGTDDYRPPRWPDPLYPKHMHLDVRVDDLDEGERKVLALGAVCQYRHETCRVYLDPAGHPFCLITQ
ncbi:VOC family protein [Actinopolymorpha sp. B17G11]|uniref:VOC family protein n=1 Tax=Actinopolymorpha sp. B17G11 TaxID=3160861 RepID=UPI0032E3C4BB